jgi:RHS repeat-associated protein
MELTWGKGFGDTMQYALTPLNFTLIHRGFTGHEHYPCFKIINMNGRLYDPVIGRFFSPDKFVANSSFTQDFNRYTYARNCPLMYTDPSGELLWIPALVIGAVWCAIQGGIMAQQQGATGWNMAAYIVGGAVIGAASAMGAYGIGVGVASAGFGPVTGMVSGALSGVFSGTVNGAGMAALAHKSPRDTYYSTLYGGLMGMGMGAVSGAIGDIGSAVKVKAVFSQIGQEYGFDTKQPIPKSFRNSDFVKYVKKGLYPYAQDPSGGYKIVGDCPELTDADIIRAGSVVGEVNAKTKTFTGGSTMYLHKELAFTSLRKLYNTLGHELVHVSQYAALAGRQAIQTASFFEMLEHYATSFSNSLDLMYYIPTTFQSSWTNEFPNTYQLVDYQNMWWTKYVYKPYK